jgi:putative transposase
MMKALTILEIAEALKVHKTSVQRRSNKEAWPFSKKAVQGGKSKCFPFDTLPKDVQLAIVNKKQQETLPVPVENNPPETIKKEAPVLNEKEMKNASNKANLLRFYTMALEAAPWGKKVAAREEFVAAYNSGIAWPTLYKELGPLSWKTLEKWSVKVRKHGNDSLYLADRRGSNRRGICSLTEEQTEIFLRCVLRPNKPLIAESYRISSAIMKQKGIANNHSEATYRRWLQRWRSRHYDMWIWSREGKKAWTDKCATYIERDINLLQVGDVVVADGHSLNFEIINPWTGKPKNHMTLILFFDMRSNMPLGWEIMPTENTASISSALRRSIIRLGKYPRVVYLDNGRAFKSKFFKGTDLDEAGYAGVYERMGCQTIFAWPYHGQSKTVERFFSTFAELERMSPTYSGTCIENKPPRMMRGEKKHRKLHEDQFGGRCLTLEEAHIVIAAWFDEYAKRAQRGHLAGSTPKELFLEGKGDGVNRAELTWLMMSLEIKTIHRNGITFQGQNYYHPALYGRRHSVTVRYDLQDTSSLWIFDEEGTLICEATPKEQLHPAAAQLGNDEDKEQLRLHIEHKRHQEKVTTASAMELLQEEVMPEHRRQMASIGVMNKVDAHPQPQKAIKVPAEKTQKVLDFDFEKAKAEAAENSRMQKESEEKGFRDGLYKLSENDRYERLLELTSQGADLDPDWIGFMAVFEKTPAYQDHRAYWETTEQGYGLMYRATQSSGTHE